MREHMHNGAAYLRNIILGGQDGLVNVLGLTLGVAAGTGDIKVILIAGLAGTFAESISMGAVAYTSSKAARDYYRSEMQREEHEIDTIPKEERKEVEDIYRKKGFRGRLLKQVVDTITSKKKIWLETMMSEELHMYPDEFENPRKDAVIVGFSSLAGSLIPLIPFFLTSDVTQGIISALILSAIVLFITGAIKAKLTVGSLYKAGTEMVAIGMLSALAGYAIGAALGAAL